MNKQRREIPESIITSTMDQDAFRNLLSSSQRSQPNGKHAVPTTIPQKAKAAPSSQPTFKPRKVKKTETNYRDRAAERRDGTGNDYAEVEAVLEDFERQVAHEDKDVAEQQRKYLGGDIQHTILVKGLDMSLLEQNRARAAAPGEDDEILEQAFTEAASTFEPAAPKKRTREDIIRDLKANRQNGDIPADQLAAAKPAEEESSTLQKARNAGKFKPIGFKPIGQTEERSKKRKIKDGKEVAKKKKRKAESIPVQSATKENNEARETSVIPPGHDTTQMPLTPQELEPSPPDDDFDIFAGAGDYEGFPVDGDSEDEHCDTEETKAESTAQVTTSAVLASSATGWFDEPRLEARHDSIPPEKSPPIPEATAANEELQEIRLRPLESSVLPSIRDFLAMDEAVEKSEKRKARKEKKKKKKKAGDDDEDD